MKRLEVGGGRDLPTYRASPGGGRGLIALRRLRQRWTDGMCGLVLEPEPGTTPVNHQDGQATHNDEKDEKHDPQVSRHDDFGTVKVTLNGWVQRWRKPGRSHGNG
jgi:hypothetical protein